MAPTTTPAAAMRQLTTYQEERKATFAFASRFLLPKSLPASKAVCKQRGEDTEILSGTAQPLNTCKPNLLCFVSHLFCLYRVFQREM